MRLLSIFFFFTGMSLHCVTAGAQWVVTDPGNTAQGIINAANTASTVKQTVDERDSHESRHYRIEGFHGDVPPDTFISIVDVLDRYFCY